MNTNEKLKISSSKAEILLYEQLPDDSEIDWEPSEDFLKKMDSVFADVDKPKMKMSFFSKFSAIAAVLIIACVAVFLPVNHYFDEMNSGNNYGLEDGKGGWFDFWNDEEDKGNNYTESKEDSDDRYLGISNDEICTDVSEYDDVSESVETLPFYPGYIPEGYNLIDAKVENDNITSTLEYSDGKNSFTFYSTTDTIDLHKHYNSYVIDYNSNSYYCNTLPTEDNKGSINNIIWFYGSNSFMLEGNNDLSAEELQRIATSFNLSPDE